MSGPKKSSSVSSSLNLEAVSSASERDLQLRKNTDEMNNEQYFLLKGFDCSKLMNQIQYRKRVEEMVKAEWDQSIMVKGFMDSVNYRDFGLTKEVNDHQLSLLRLSSDIPSVFGSPLKNFKNGSVLVTISEALKSCCCCDVLLYQLEAIPDIGSLIKNCQERTGVTLGIDSAKNFWLYGMWFQVAVTRHFINSQFANVETMNTVKDNKSDKKEALVYLEELLNGTKMRFTHQGEEVTFENNSSQWYDAGLFCLTFLSFNMKGISDIELDLLNDVDIHQVQLVVSSLSKDACQKYCRDFTSQYEDNQEIFGTIGLPSTYPNRYTDMLKDMIQAKYHPDLIVTMNTGRTVDIVLAKQRMSEVKKFIKTYLECNAPKKASNRDDLMRMAKPLGPVAWPWSDSVEDSTSSTRHIFRKADENDKVYIGMFAKPVLHVEYLQKECKSDLDSICDEYDTELQYEKGHILVEFDDKSKLVNCLWRLEKLYNRMSIQTREIPSQYLPANQKGLHTKPVNSNVVSVTGKSSAMSFIAETMEDVNAAGKSQLLENIMLNPASSTYQEHMHQRSNDSEKRTSISRREGKRRDRQLVDPTMLLTQEKERTELLENIQGRKHIGPREYSYTKTAGTVAYQHIVSESYVEVGCGNITKLKVDTIVNAANYKLQHVGGVARAIVVAGGESIQTESTRIVQKGQLKTGDVCITGAGKLPCKMIIHAVAPAYDQYQNKQDCIADLGRTFWSCFDQANQNGFVSMAIPPLGAGQYAIPVNDVAQAACETLQDFLNQYPHTSLRFIRFVDIKDDVLAICRRKLDIMVKGKYFAKM